MDIKQEVSLIESLLFRVYKFGWHRSSFWAVCIGHFTTV